MLPTGIGKGSPELTMKGEGSGPNNRTFPALAASAVNQNAIAPVPQAPEGVAKAIAVVFEALPSVSVSDMFAVSAIRAYPAPDGSPVRRPSTVGSLWDTPK